MKSDSTFFIGSQLWPLKPGAVTRFLSSVTASIPSYRPSIEIAASSLSVPMVSAIAKVMAADGDDVPCRPHQ